MSESVSECVTLFYPYASDVVVSFDWARDVVGCVRRSVSCAETLVGYNTKVSAMIGL